MNKSTIRGQARSTPRNPLVAAARFRQAGVHGGGRKRERQHARHDLTVALRHLKDSP